MKKPTIVILHGWGASSKSFAEVKELLENEGYSIEVPDLPGFGSAPLTKDPMTFEDYIHFVENIVGNRKVILIGHSFGARLAIRFASRKPDHVEELILTGASGIVHPLTSKQKAAYLLAKGGKQLGLSSLRKTFYRFVGEWDYYTAGPLAKTFKQVHRVSIENDLGKILASTLLVWGENDKITPFADGQLMHKNIKGSELIVVKGATHKLPYAMPHVFVEKILPFLKEN